MLAVEARRNIIQKNREMKKGKRKMKYKKWEIEKIGNRGNRHICANKSVLRHEHSYIQKWLHAAR